MKARVSEIVDAYTKTVMLCMNKIKEVNDIHKDQSEESKAYETKKVIDKWFLKGGRI